MIMSACTIDEEERENAFRHCGVFSFLAWNILGLMTYFIFSKKLLDKLILTVYIYWGVAKW